MRRSPVPPIVVYTGAAFEPDDPRSAGLGTARGHPDLAPGASNAHRPPACRGVVGCDVPGCLRLLVVR
eukprot:scaffold4934_cov128-Isochrysis_galbana.AAC.3